MFNAAGTFEVNRQIYEMVVSSCRGCDGWMVSCLDIEWPETSGQEKKMKLPAAGPWRSALPGGNVCPFFKQGLLFILIPGLHL